MLAFLLEQGEKMRCCIDTIGTLYPKDRKAGYEGAEGMISPMRKKTFVLNQGALKIADGSWVGERGYRSSNHWACPKGKRMKVKVLNGGEEGCEERKRVADSGALILVVAEADDTNDFDDLMEFEEEKQRKEESALLSICLFLLDRRPSSAVEIMHEDMGAACHIESATGIKGGRVKGVFKGKEESLVWFG
ncbi:hypothetical protein BJ684DRAFT_17212 [Piptocephalis cylindrospora]|uniref:Uncharacterized protein n=1 Tax=Piptocephalis cylindrospora TaxID=1907219 RepID=A0A4P9Y0M8_9FUNG|nr:hypothetical protein BJ684DRAFT_17212 [Piptocephalis cylindrospora]|eukprot:RKP12287.1 hypothetical protein BJ684DRAFT_17212 [Piptocephalis cylindrospora]